MDPGSELLLRGLPELPAWQAPGARVLDLGCGTGVLGICLKKENPGLELELVDRDALALAFSALNCRLNGVQARRIEGRLGAAGLEEGAYDLVVSNLPAKVGAPVLRALIQGAVRRLREGGVFAFVIVHPLEELARRTLEETQAELLLHRSGRDYAVFQARRPAQPPSDSALAPTDPLAPYLRGRAAFTAADHTYELDTAYNLPDFDTLGYDTQLAARLLDSLHTEDPGAQQGRVLVWNPGQGHVPIWLTLCGLTGRRLTLAGRDLLQLRVSGHNLLAHAAEGFDLQHRALLSEVEGEYALAVVFPDVDPGVHWEEGVTAAGAVLLSERGRLVAASSGTAIQRMEKARRPLHLVRAVRGHGRRAVLLVRKPAAPA